jgi:hypothetical protein
MAIVKVVCDFCKNEFDREASYIRGELKKNPNHLFYCSKKCVYDHRTRLKKINVVCTFCKKECITDENDLKRNKNYYCSRECYDNYRKIPLEQRREMVSLVCPQCNKPFSIFKYRYDKKKLNGYKLTFCSAKCSSESQRNDYSKDFLLKCDQCNTDIIKTGRQMKITKLHFCTPSCKGSYFAKLHALGAKRSKLEERIEEYIKNQYPKLQYIINDRELLKGLELDFYFPTLNFAIEINGPAHFTPIYGDESLIKTKRHDIIKKIICKKKNIRLLEITNTLHPYNDNSRDIYENHILPILKPIIENIVE